MHDRETQLRQLEEYLGHKFENRARLEQALTHSSAGNELDIHHNEPLEFLGDAVLGMYVTQMIHTANPAGREGAKSVLRSKLVGAENLAMRAQAAGIPALLRLGTGEEKTGGRQKKGLWADAYEAVIAALYLDGGVAAGLFIMRDINLNQANKLDAKSVLQERLQARGLPVPEYIVICEEGPAHRREFLIECNTNLGTALGRGYSKKEAEQNSAEVGLKIWYEYKD